jgi:outer membrane protein OmpA-like peptidoglycan-associated protein
MLPDLRSIPSLLIALCLTTAMSAQKDGGITLQNPSFEDLPGPSKTPTGWYSCGQVTDSPPDVQPGSFSVAQAPFHGSSYIGLVVRDDETWESVSQRLSKPLEKDQCYEMSMALCKAEEYRSQSRKSGEPANFATPAKLIIWGGNGYCDKGEVLFETPIITNTRWLVTNFRFHPKKGNWNYIMFEAYYKTPVLFPFNGNILMDNASAIKPVACNPEPMVMTEKPAKKPPTTAKGDTAPVKKTTPAVATVPVKPKPTPPPPPVVNSGFGKSLKKGRVYRLDKVYFDANKYELKPEGEEQLEDLLTLMKNNPDIAIEVGGHTNNNMHPDEAKAIGLSTNRAKAVADWLISNGVAASRVKYVGYGWKNPIEPNTSEEGRKKNQRVEVKVLTSNG